MAEVKNPGAAGAVTADPLQDDLASKKRMESGYYFVVSQKTAEGHLMIGRDIQVFPEKECPVFASPATKAFEARDRRLLGEQFVLICGRSAVPRVTSIGTYKGLKSASIIKLVDAGIVDWPPENRQRFALVYEKPLGKKILESAEAEKPYMIPEDKIIQAVIEPAVRALAEFRDVDFVHGAINAENVYMVGPQGLEQVVLGDCLSSAPSWRQHPLYETPSRAQAQASGRGVGTIKDDLYALGVCVAMLARGENLLRGKTPQQVIHEKIELGSYATIIGKDRIPGGVTEFLRGVLNDDESQRWDLNAVLLWLEGRRLSPKQARLIMKAARPLVFQGHKYWDLKSLAQAFSENIPEAAAEIEKGELAVWIKRNFEDKGLDARVEKVLAKEKEAARDRLVFAVCTAMDPWGPVRYKGLSLFPTGMGMALAQAIAKGEDIRVHAEIIAQQMMNAWLSQSFDEIPDAAAQLAHLERCRSVLVQKMPGYGIERVLYMMNMEVACLSPLLENYIVLTPGNLLMALEEISRKPDRPDVLLDRHMMAFVSVREPRMIDQHLGYLNSGSRGHHVIGTIRTLAAIQRRFSIGAVPGVCGWLISLTQPAIDLLNDRTLRQEISKKVGALQNGGNLMTLLDIVDNPLLTKNDMQKFALARQEYGALAAEKARIAGYLRNRKDFGRATGRQAAMLLSVLLSLGIIVAYVVLRYMKML